jgi:hypothetical protein
MVASNVMDFMPDFMFISHSATGVVNILRIASMNFSPEASYTVIFYWFFIQTKYAFQPRGFVFYDF